VNHTLLARLLLDALAAGLLLLGLSYWWLGNTVHEIVGTAMFLLLMLHNVFNRRWYGRLAAAGREPRSLFNIGVTMGLLAVMLVLLGTSILISEALSPILPIQGGFTARQIHTLAAYWALIIVSIHLGLRWPMIMGVARHVCGIRQASASRVLLLRCLALLIVFHGAWSGWRLGLGTRLSMQMTLDWWDFEASALGFFVHCVAVSGAVIAAVHYAGRFAGWRRGASPRRAARSAG
jgi:hypothetical protein